jgi:hypothetical protein
MSQEIIDLAANKLLESIGKFPDDPHYYTDFLKARADIRAFLREEEAVEWARRQKAWRPPGWLASLFRRVVG